jgi:hypothetical protein
VAGLRELDAAIALAGPRAWHGLSTPRETRRVRRQIEQVRERLRQLVSTPRGTTPK